MPIRPLKTQKVDGLDVDVWVRELPARLYVEVADLCVDLDKKPRAEQIKGLASICVYSCISESGEPLFASPDAVLDESTSFIETCVEAAMQINGLGGDDAKNA